MPRCSVILLALVLVGACDSRQKEPPDLVKSQRQAMEKAKGTEAVIDRATAERFKKAEQGAK